MNQSTENQTVKDSSLETHLNRRNGPGSAHCGKSPRFVCRGDGMISKVYLRLIPDSVHLSLNLAIWDPLNTALQAVSMATE